jgi:hypothetical protein
MPRRARSEAVWSKLPWMDRTAVATIVIGLGSTVAAMFFPTQYPTAPTWLVRLGWWGGLLLIAVGILFLAIEHPISDLATAIAAVSEWVWGSLVAAQELPGFWTAVGFAGGLAAYRWFLPLWRTRSVRQPSPQVKEWLTPHQAIEAFVPPALLSERRTAQARAKELRERLDLAENKVESTEDGDKLRFAIELQGLQAHYDNTVYIYSHRCADVIENFYDQLRSGHLVAKGDQVKQRKVVKSDKFIDASYWKVSHADRDILDLDTRRASTVLGTYENIMIGKNEPSER